MYNFLIQIIMAIIGIVLVLFFVYVLGKTITLSVLITIENFKNERRKPDNGK